MIERLSSKISVQRWPCPNLLAAILVKVSPGLTTSIRGWGTCLGPVGSVQHLTDADQVRVADGCSVGQEDLRPAAAIAELLFRDPDQGVTGLDDVRRGGHLGTEHAGEAEEVRELECPGLRGRQRRDPSWSCEDGVGAPAYQPDEYLRDDRAADRTETVTPVMLGFGEQVVPERRTAREASRGQRGCLARSGGGLDLTRRENGEVEVRGDCLAGRHPKPVATEQVANRQPLQRQAVAGAAARRSPAGGRGPLRLSRRARCRSCGPSTTFGPAPITFSHSMIQFSGSVSVSARAEALR